MMKSTQGTRVLEVYHYESAGDDMTQINRPYAIWYQGDTMRLSKGYDEEHSA